MFALQIPKAVPSPAMKGGTLTLNIEKTFKSRGTLASYGLRIPADRESADNACTLWTWQNCADERLGQDERV